MRTASLNPAHKSSPAAPRTMLAFASTILIPAFALPLAALSGCTLNNPPSQHAAFATELTPAITPQPVEPLIASLHAAAQSLPSGVLFIEAHLDNNTIASGTAVLVGPGHVLTALHVVHTARRIELTFGGRAGHPPIVVDLQPHAITQTWSEIDLALLSGFEAPEWALPVPIATHPPEPGETVLSVGLDRPDGVRLRSGRVCGSARADGRFAICVSDWLGDSGGPVFNNIGELVGINAEIGDIPHAAISQLTDPITRSKTYLTSTWLEPGTIAIDVTAWAAALHSLP